MLCIIDVVGGIPEFFFVLDRNAIPLYFFEPHHGVRVNTILYVEVWYLSMFLLVYHGLDWLMECLTDLRSYLPIPIGGGSPRPTYLQTYLFTYLFTYLS